MTTPTTQDEKEPLSLVDHLRTTLYNPKAQHTRVQDAIGGYRSAATPDDEYRDLLASCERTTEQLEQQITAQEQSIAILSVLADPAFERLNHVRPEAQPEFLRVTLYRNRDLSGHDGATPIDALLKAHTALNPQKGAGESKGGPADA